MSREPAHASGTAEQTTGVPFDPRARGAFRFYRIPKGLTADRELSAGAKLTWCVLADHNLEGGCFPGYERIRDLVGGKSIRQIERYIDELELRGLILVEREKTGKTRRNRFTFLRTPALDYTTNLSCSGTGDDATDMSCSGASYDTTETSGSEPDNHTTNLSGSEVHDTTNLASLPDISDVHYTTNLVKTCGAIRKDRDVLTQTFEKDKQAGRQDSGASAATIEDDENAPARPPVIIESRNTETQEPESASLLLIRETFTQNGIVIRDPSHITEILEIAQRANCPPDLLAEFIRRMATEKGIEKSTLVRDVTVEHLAAWMNRSEGRAAAAAIDAATRPPVPRECGGCRGAGIKASSPVSWCHCALGEQRKERHEPVFVKRDECLNCASTLGWHLRENPEKALCFFCSRPEQNGSRAVTEFELATARTQLQTRGPIPNCEPCGKRGYLSRNAGQEEELIKFCTCNWGARLRKLKGEHWDEEQTQLARDLWQQLNAACPGKPCKSEAELRLHTADRRLVTEP